jgi:hypothetical protein
MFIVFIEPRFPNKRVVPYSVKIKDECLADRFCLLFRRKGYMTWVEYMR